MLVECFTKRWQFSVRTNILAMIYITCTMLLEQIKGFYHGIFLLDWLVVIPCLVGICKDVYVVVHVRIDCGVHHL